MGGGEGEATPYLQLLFEMVDVKLSVVSLFDPNDLKKNTRAVRKEILGWKDDI